MSGNSVSRRLAAVLVADVAGYSRLMQADELGTLARLQRLLREVIEPAVTAHQGRVVKTTGDGIIAEFSSSTGAVRCAIAVQGRPTEEPSGIPALRLRIGIAAGDVLIADDREIYGDVVNLAARIEALAAPGGILVTEAVREQAAGKVAARLELAGRHRLKNMAGTVELYRAVPEPKDGVSAPQARASSAPAVPTVAVLPFRAISRDPDHLLLAEAITEDLTTRLARVPGFFVIARYSAATYAGSSADPGAIAHELGVRYVVEGSLRPAGENRLRVTARLIDAGQAGGVQIWGGQFETACDLRFGGTDDEITRAVIGRLGVELSVAEMRVELSRPPADHTAWTHFRQAFAGLLQHGWNEESFAEAEQQCRHALARDSDFALAHGLLALTLGLGRRFSLIRRPDAEAEALGAAERAMALGGNNSDILGLSGCALSDLGHTGRGIPILERAIEEDPSNSQAWVALGIAFVAERRAAEGIERIRHGIRVGPRDIRMAVWQTFLASGLMDEQRAGEALVEADIAGQLDAKLYPARIVRAAALLRLCREAEAAAALDAARRIYPRLTFHCAEAWVGHRLATELRALCPALLPIDAADAVPVHETRADAAMAVAEVLRSLSPREREVLGLVARGLANPAIAGELGLSGHTVKRHVANILTKLDLPSRSAAAALAARNGVS